MEGIRSPLRMVLEGVEGFALLALVVGAWPVARRLLLDLGTTREERTRSWPGDGLLPCVDACATRAITVRAPAHAAWPWLQQFGLRRGGFHAYELLERLGGIDVRNLERVRPELQTLAVGDEILLHPSAPGLWLAMREPGRHLCWRTWRDDDDLAARDPATAASFSLYLVPVSRASCRLLVRTCKHDRRPRDRGARLVARTLEEPLDLVMEQRMLRTLRRLAERGPA